ncbi:MAG: DUF4344 domain-containing metallopeptidase [Mycobacterium sp.]
MRLRMAPLVAAALLVSACGGSPQPDEAPTVDSTVEATPEVAAAEVESVPDDGDMVVTYEEATSPEALNGKRIMQDAGVLEDLAQSVNESFNLPYDIPLLGAECGVANAFWSPSDQSMTICYEDADLAEQIFIQAGDPDPAASAINTEVATFYHELGHMVIDLYDLPVTGREEDVADQLSAYVMLQEDEDGNIDPDSIQVVRDFAREFQGYAQMGGDVGDSQFADVHSLNQTRMYNLLCWVYGADSEGSADMVDNGELPADRADGCEDEYAKMQYAWASLLEPYLKG